MNPVPKKMNLLGLADVCSLAGLFIDFSAENESPAAGTISEAKKSKSQNALAFTCTDDIRNLNPKTLVEKFSESTANELKRRYSYKCVILPDECDAVFESYGSEKKASDNMKQHLQIHLIDLEKRILNGSWPPESENVDETVSPSTKPNQKSSKKSLKAQHLTGVKMPPKRRAKSQNKYKSSKASASTSPVKDKKLNGFHSSGVKMFSFLAVSTKVTAVVSSKPTNQGFSVNSEDKKDENMVVEEVVQDSTLEICGPLCAHVNCSLSQPSTSHGGQYSKHTTVDNSSDESSAALENVLVQAISLEHSYSAVKGVKIEKPSPEVIKDNPTRKRRGCRIPQQLIIRTPPFPYVHVPLLPDCAGVEEVGLIRSSDDVKKDDLDYSSDKQEANNDPCQEEKAPVVKVKRVIKKPRKQEVSSSVLECVENRVDMNTSSIRVPNNLSLSPEHNIENSENLQKAEKEMALRYIAKLKSKKKKQYQGPLECQICEHKTFTALATLIHHYRSHAGIKPYSCKLCDSTFTRKHSLNYHMLIHRNISRFTCLQCDRVFRHPSHFKEHMRRHTGETPFICSTCLLKFKTRNTYKRHLKVQHQKLLTARGRVEDLPVVVEHE